MGEARRRSATLTAAHERDLITSAEELTAITFYHFTDTVNFIGPEGVAELERCDREGGAQKSWGRLNFGRGSSAVLRSKR
jgi:hypothetical protein